MAFAIMYLGPSSNSSTGEGNTSRGQQTRADGNDAEQEEMPAGEKQKEEDNVVNALREYAVDPIWHHIGKCNSIKFVVRWYCYTPVDDTEELLVYIQEHFITP